MTQEDTQAANQAAQEAADMPNAEEQAALAMRAGARANRNAAAAAQNTAPQGSVRRVPTRRVSDEVDNGLWPDLPQTPNQDLLGVDFIIDEIRTLQSREFGTDYCVIKCADPETGDEFTTICGGSVVVEKLHTLAAGKKFPILASFQEVQPKRGGRPYLDLI